MQSVFAKTHIGARGQRTATVPGAFIHAYVDRRWSHFVNLISPRPLRGRRGGDWCVLAFLEISADM